MGTAVNRAADAIGDAGMSAWAAAYLINLQVKYREVELVLYADNGLFAGGGLCYILDI